MLRDTCIIVTSDHGHCEVLADADAATIRLDRALGDMKRAALGQPWADGDEIAICPNMRASQIYLRQLTPARLAAVTSRALDDPRVDHVCWATGERAEGGRGYAITSATRGRLDFWKGGGGSQASDAAGTLWGWLGDLEVADAAIDDDRLVWGDYPECLRAARQRSRRAEQRQWCGQARMRVRGRGGQRPPRRRLARRAARARVCQPAARRWSRRIAAALSARSISRRSVWSCSGFQAAFESATRTMKCPTPRSTVNSPWPSVDGSQRRPTQTVDCRPLTVDRRPRGLPLLSGAGRRGRWEPTTGMSTITLIVAPSATTSAGVVRSPSMTAVLRISRRWAATMLPSTVPEATTDAALMVPTTCDSGAASERVPRG